MFTLGNLTKISHDRHFGGLNYVDTQPKYRYNITIAKFRPNKEHFFANI